MSGLGTLLVIGGAVYLAAYEGLFGTAAKSAARGLHVATAPVAGALGTSPVPCPSAEELATKLGVSVWKVRTGMAQTGKDGCSLTAADLSGIPEVPDTVTVGGVASHPNPNGAPATWSNPTGGSGTWGGLTDSQIQASFLAAAGGDPAKAQQMWEQQHAAEVAAHGF